MAIKYLANKKIIATLLSVLAIIAGASFWYFWPGGYRLEGRKQLVSEIESINAPENSVIEDGKIHPRPLSVLYTQPVADMPKIGKPLENGVSIVPAIRGVWQWQNDRTLTFEPETDWLPDTEYKVSLSKEIFNPQVKVKDKSFTFASPQFAATVDGEEFYEDPKEPGRKSAVASFRFNYPLNTQNLRDKVEVKTISGKKYDFSYKLTDADTVLHIISAPLTIGDTEDFVRISVAGAENKYNRKSLKEPLTAQIKVPSSSSFFKLVSLQSSIVRNEQKNDAPEQIVFATFTTAVDAKSLAENFSLYYSKDFCYDVNEKLAVTPGKLPYHTSLRKLVPVNVSPQDGPTKTHMFKYDESGEKGCLVAMVKKGLRSAEGFVLGADIVKTFVYSAYPVEAKIAFDGSVLPLKGKRELAFVSRGATGLDVKIGRINADDLNHLVTQTSGDFAHPYFFNYNFSEDNITEQFEKELAINAGHPSEANYSSLDLNEYFQNKKGVFLVELQGRKSGRRIGSPDRRLVIITDLGIVVKVNRDKTHNLFISNISAGEPVAGARVEVLGKNGLPVLTAETNSEGMAFIPDFSSFENAKRPVVYKVSKGNDVSFIPIGKSDRVLNFSRFDVGGEYEYDYDGYSFKGYIFSDRGVYRPGEQACFGAVIRQNDLKVPQKLPLIFKVYNPRRDIVATQKVYADAAGFVEYCFTPKDTARTGLYTINLYAQISNRRHSLYRSVPYFVTSTEFKVEEFVPDNMRIKAVWDTPAAKGWLTNKTIKAKVSLYNLYGNPAPEHTLKASYSLIPATFSFAGYAGYVFADPAKAPDKTLRAMNNELPEQKTNAAGEGTFEIDLSQFERGTYRLNLYTDGLEAGGGRGVSNVLSTMVSPNEYLVGWKADGALTHIKKDAVRKVNFVALDNNLSRIAKSGLQLSLAKRRYVSGLIEMPNGTYRYQMVPKEDIVSAHSWNLAAEGTEETLKTDVPGEYVLSVTDDAGQVMARVEYTVAGAANLTYSVDRDASLGLKLNRNEYNGGDTIEMQITAPYSGYGLITIEQDKVYAYKWFRAKTTSVAEQIVLPKNVEGNAYINVAFFRDVNSREIFMPSLSYAAAPFAIGRDTRRLEVALNVPQTVKPGQDLTIGYKTSTDAKIVIFGANQGILQVAKYKTPNPLDAFLKKKALEVVTSQIMDLVMPDITILRMLSSSGGGDGGADDVLGRNLNPFARKSDKPVAFWSGILTASEKEGTYTYKVPETFNGEIKIMAVAISPERFGSAAKSVSVRGDFSLTPSGPLNVSPGDEFVIGVSVGNMVEDSGQGYRVKAGVESENGFEVIGQTSQVLQIDENGEKLAQFRFKAKQNLGAKELVFFAESVDDATHKARMPYTMSIRPSVPYGTKFAMGYEKSEYKLSGIENLYPEYRIQQLSASSSPMVLAAGLLTYLDKFPHYCTEQTVSKVFPAIEVFFKYPELVKNTDVYALFNNAISILRERQTLNGGFSAWSVSGMEASPYASVYAAHFLVKAKEYNFNVPENMLKRALSYCEERAAENPDGVDDIVPPYAAYVLTLSGKVTTNYLLKLEEFYRTTYKKEWKQSLGATLLAASYNLLQDNKKAEELPGNFSGDGTLVQSAMNAYLDALYFPKNLESFEQKEIEKMLGALSKGDFTTDSAAWSVLALNALGSKESDKNIVFSGHTPLYTPFPTADFTPQTTELTVQSQTPFYYAVTQAGFLVDEKINAKAEGLEVAKSYYDKDGKPITQAKLGDELTVKIMFRSLRGKFVSDVAIVDLLPGCFEVVSGSLQKPWVVKTADVREDRVVAYATAYDESNEFTYRVKVIAEGNFIMPAVYASALYQPLVRANSASGMIKVGD